MHVANASAEEAKFINRRFCVEANRTLSYPQFAVTVESSRKYIRADLVVANKTTTDYRYSICCAGRIRWKSLIWTLLLWKSQLQSHIHMSNLCHQQKGGTQT
jgi:hypothetical protein